MFASTSLRYRVRSRRLAVTLWGTDAEGKTWEYIYFVGELRNQNITYTELAAVLGFASDYVVLGLNLLDEAKSQAVLRAFALRMINYSPTVRFEQLDIDTDLGRS